MRIGGFQKNSLIDFPGEMACLVFTPGCNLVCPYCHNPDLARGRVDDNFHMDQAAVMDFLKARQGFLGGVAITGGEPSLQPDLVDFIRQVRELGYKVKLDSNGSRPEVLKELLDKEWVEYIAMDIKTRLDNYPDLARGELDISKLRESMALIRSQAPDYEFRTTCVRPFITREIMGDIARELAGAKRYILQTCSRNVEMLDTDFMADEQRFFTPEEMEELANIARETMDIVELR